ncbi:MAG TPA: helix-turn-helix transcriptional regulator [Mucilaginibacter sp.]|nr:helix-turn-helix transcriptional regulator [Mucilaginibacter sp.]
MRYYTIPPPTVLKSYVRCFWVLEHDFGEEEDAYVYRSIADGCVEVVFHYRAAFNELITGGQPHNWQSGIHFQSSRYRRFETRESFGIFGAYIYPFAVPCFFNVPSTETSNEMLSLDTFLGQEGRELEEKIMLAPSNQARAAILSAYFEKKLHKAQCRDKHIATSIKHLIHTDSAISVEDLAKRFNLSTRQFGRKFKEYAGFSPKMYMRLTRLTNAVKLQKTDKSLSEIAYACGYYDQSHFIHEVKLFTGYHPSFYFSGKAEGTEYIYI